MQAQRILQLAHCDDITELPHRQCFAELASPALERARLNGSGCAVLHADIDRFTGVNDAYDCGSGDAVLMAIAERLR